MVEPFSLAARAALPLPMDVPGVSPALWPVLLQAAAGARIALVGGAVRDLLLHLRHRDPWLGLPDLDLVLDAGGAAVEVGETAPAIAFAQRLAAMEEAVRVCEFRAHLAYGTAEITLALPVAVAAPAELLLQLDLATARVEAYPVPGANPRVRFGTLETDLARRDFSINAMALVLESAPAVRFALLDPHNGQAALARRELCLLHDDSLRDDPTRLVRAARYAARLGFALAADSRAQAAATLATWPWAWKPGDDPQQAPAALASRLRMELELLLNREPWQLGLAALQDWGGLLLLDPQLQADRHWRRRLRWAQWLGLPLLVALLAGADQPLALAARLQLPAQQQRQLADAQRLWQRLQLLGWGEGARAQPWSPSRWCALLEGEGLCPEAALVLIVQCRGPRRPLLRWYCRWRQIRPAMRGRDLIAAGMAPGRAIGEELRRQRQLLLDRERR